MDYICFDQTYQSFYPTDYTDSFVLAGRHPNDPFFNHAGSTRFIFVPVLGRIEIELDIIL